MSIADQTFCHRQHRPDRRPAIRDRLRDASSTAD